MHKEQTDFVTKIKKQNPEYFENKKILDIGSWDINGNNRHLFTNCDYRGVDLAEGENVDIISLAHELSFPPHHFDTIISTEMLEHDPYFYRSIPKMFSLLKPNGLLLITCAGIKRHIHGTISVAPAANLATVKNMHFFKNYYRNILKEDLTHLLNPDANFSAYTLSLENNDTDLYFYGIKRG